MAHCRTIDCIQKPQVHYVHQIPPDHGRVESTDSNQRAWAAGKQKLSEMRPNYRTPDILGDVRNPEPKMQTKLQSKDQIPLEGILSSRYS